MKVVFAPDKFAGTLTAAEAAGAMVRGWRRVRSDDQMVQRPMADGGEGTVAVVETSRPDAVRQWAEVADARGIAVEASWLLLPDGTALVEAAAACGLSRLAEKDRDPLRLTSYGVGQLLRAAEAAGASSIVVGLGGSATVDGGAGAATALGHRLLREDGNGVKVGGAWLRDVHVIRQGPPLRPEVVVAVDVTNPLLGADGAAPVFGPQKGASPEDVRVLSAGLERFADVVERDLPGGPWRDLPGAGAAGGLGFALAAFADARIAAGSQTIADLVGFAEAVEDADLVVTGEGSLDAQTGAGKAPEYVRQQAVAAGARVAAIAGRITEGAGDRYSAALDLGPDGMTRASELVTERTAALAQMFDDR